MNKKTHYLLDGSYEVEEIVKKKFIKGEPFYNVKWTGYDESQNTWEPENHLPGAMVQEFNENNIKQKNLRKIYLFKLQHQKKKKNSNKESESSNSKSSPVDLIEEDLNSKQNLLKIILENDTLDQLEKLKNIEIEEEFGKKIYNQGNFPSHIHNQIEVV